ncbi:MAG: c-type cytochrome, partial [Flavisolibacter sp.]
MKKFALISFVVFMVSCGSNSADKKESSDTKQDNSASSSTQSSDPDVEKGMNLVAKSDCLTCHQVEQASTGPAYMAVAGKYPDNDAVIDSLSKKVINGGSGNWGTVPMTPHPSISPEDAK